MKTQIITIVLIFFYGCINAQVKSHFSKQRIMKKHDFFNVDTLKNYKEIVGVDVKKARLEDEMEKDLGLPFRFGIPVDVNYSLETSGKWFENDQGKVWKLKIRSKNAYSINLIFDRLNLSDNSVLYIYNEGRTMIYGPVTKKVLSKKDGRFGTDLIQGNTIILELFEPKEEEGENQLIISKVIHGYKNLFSKLMNYGDSYSYPCQVDVNCYNYPDQSDGVAMILISDNDRICTGTLLNNACQDFTPNILTAFHCLDIGNNRNSCESTAFDGVISTTEQNRAENWVFRFQYISPSCNGPEPPSSTWVTFNRSTYIAGWEDSDFALVQMLDSPDGESNLQYQGWSRTPDAPIHGISLHHPVGDVMKVSWYNNPASTNSDAILFGNGCIGKEKYYPENHLWEVPFTGGTVQGGSSGAPLFDQNFRVVGQLLGGPDGCAPITKRYGKLDRSWGWDENGDFLENRDATNSLAPWLTNDPTVISVNRLGIPDIQRTSGEGPVCSSYTGFSLINPPPTHSVSWDVTPNLTIISQGSSSLLTKYSGSGNGTATISVVVQNSNAVLCPVSATFTREVQAGPFTTSQVSFTGTAAVCPDTYYTYTAGIPGGHLSSYTYSWTYPSNWMWPSYSQNTLRLKTPMFDPQYGTVRVSVNNGCGATSYTGVTVYPGYSCGYYFSYAPNPVTDELTVTAIPVNTEENNENIEPEYSVEFEIQLYDSNTNIVKKKKSKYNKANLKTNDLKKGTYFLHIIHQEQVFREQIMVE